MAGNQVRNHCKHVMEMGESSSTGRSNIDDYDYDRPFKKAKYVWQLKGKYHLKTSPNNATLPTIVPPTSQLNQDGNNSSDTDSDSLALNDPLTLATPDKSNKEATLSPCSFSNQQTEDVPVTMVMPRNQTQEEYLEQWQASQLAKGYVDNTINSLLELWKIAPLDGDAADELDSTEDEHVEDEGILMAIQSHGLQTSMPTAQNQLDQDAIACRETAGTSQICSETVSSFLEPSQSQTLENTDFLSAAVTAAIKKKGLSSYNFG